MQSELDDSDLRQELRQGELIYWQGQPSALLLALGQLWASVFGCFFLSVPLSTYFQFFKSWDGDFSGIGFFQVFLVPFVGVGVWLASSAPVAYLSAPYVKYAVTNQRIIILQLFLRRRVQSYEPADINGIDRRDVFGNRSTLLFRSERARTGDGDSIRRRGFYGVEDGRAAELAIMRLREAGKA